jgi:predicted nucleic-acid-binding protein
MRAVDTNVLVRLLVGDDTKQLAAAETFVAAGAWVPQLAVAEAMRVLASVYGQRPDAIADAVEMLLDHQQLTIQGAETVAAALAVFRRHPSVGFTDCLLLEVARKSGHVPLGTFDRGLSKLESAHKL